MVRIIAAGVLAVVMVAAAIHGDVRGDQRLGVAGEAAVAINSAMRQIHLDPSNHNEASAVSARGKPCEGWCAGGALPIPGAAGR